VVLKTLFGLAIGIPLPFLLPAIRSALGIVALSYLLLTVTKVNCDDIFSKLPQFEDISISYIDRSQIRTSKIYIKGDKNLPGFKLYDMNMNKCSEEKILI
jgi:hypothetical protein